MMETNIVQVTTFGEILTKYTPPEFWNPVFNDLKVFIDNNNQCWFIGSKVAERLGYTNSWKAIRDHVNPQYRMEVLNDLFGTLGESLAQPNESFGSQTYINENSIQPNKMLGSQTHTGGRPIVLIHERGLYDQYVNQGLTLTQNKEVYDPKSRINIKIDVITGWTQKGKEFIYSLLVSNGYKSNNI